MLKTTLLLFISLFTIHNSLFTIHHSRLTSHVSPLSDKIEWISFEEATQKQKEHFKPIYIDLYTDWCHWCKVMDRETYTDPNVINYINDKFYAVKLNAETRDTIKWKGNVYTYDPRYRVNSFSLYITDNQPSFPTTVFLTDDKTAPMALPGYFKPKEIELMVKYVGEGAYNTKSFQIFQHDFKASW
jgi:uncharacterized protein YyaL (SSP411 family)